jgi:hypothetical protein
MPVTAKERRACAALLDEGEQLRYVIPTMAAGHGVTYYPVDCYIAVTDLRVLVLFGGTLRRGRPKEINQAFGRATALGPVLQAGSSPCTIEIGGRFFELSEEYAAVVAAADAEIDGHTLPRDPFPDL